MRGFSKTMKKTVNFLVFFLLLSGMISLETIAQTDKQVSLIQKIYQETAEKQADCETNGETSTTFLSEIIVNKNNGSYPAVGIYQKSIKFFYTFGNREKTPYPKRLLKIVITLKRSSQTEYFEFLFDSQENLIFHFEKSMESEKRLCCFI